MPLGVQTHFGQNWPAALVDTVRRSGALSIRDGAPWPRGEPAPGRYDLASLAALDAICRDGTSLLLTIAPRHPNYDDGQTAHTPPAIAAFARYVGAVAARYGACLIGVEVGNEINDPRNLPYPAGIDRAGSYVALMRAVRAELRRRGSTAAVLGGSNVIGTGFLDTLFAAGLLDVADVIAVHPYRSQAENVDIEIAHLRAAMRHRGRVRPIWATEFSDNYATPEIAAEELVKMVTLLSAAGVDRAYWYALVDQRWFRNMGLYEANGRAKPAAFAFGRMAALAAAARAVPVDVGDPGIRLYRFGRDAYVLWGGGGSVVFEGARMIRDAYGRKIDARTAAVAAGPVPMIVIGARAAHRQEPSAIVADSLFGYGRPPWSYLARTSDGATHPLAMSDGTWESSHFSRLFQPLRIGDSTAAVAGTAAAPIRAILRYTAPVARKVSVSACFLKQDKGDGVDIAVVTRGRTMWRQVLTHEATLTGIPVELARGDTLDISVGPNRVAGGDAFAYRVRLFARGAARPVACPHRPQPVD